MAAAGAEQHAPSTVLQTLKGEAHALLINKQKLVEVADEVTAQIAAQVQEQVQGMKRSSGTLPWRRPQKNRRGNRIG